MSYRVGRSISQVENSMKVAPLQLFPDLGKQKQNLLFRPFKNATEQPKREALEPFQGLRQVAHAKVLHPLVLGPRTDGDLEQLVLDVLEARVLDPLRLLGAGAGFALQGACCAEKGVNPGERAVLVRQAAVVGVVLQVVVLELGPAAGLEVARNYQSEFLHG